MSEAEISQPTAAGEVAAMTRLPLDVFAGGPLGLSAQAEIRWLWGFLLVGFALRLARYLLCFPLWEDECLLSSNYLDRGYLELLQPLGYYQVCPPLFLWCQLAMTRLLGFNEYALRLVPMLCAMGSLVLFRHVAGRLLRGTTLVLAVGLFAVSYPMVRYTAEAKPYGCDLMLTLVMLALLVEWLRRPDQSRWVWALAAMVGPAVGFSYPVVFVSGMVSLVVAYVLWSARGRGWLPWLTFNLMLLSSFAVLLWLNRMAVGDANQQRMVEGWANMFPPIAQPLKLIGWLFSTHAGAMLGYPFGGPHWGSTLTLIACVIGIAGLIRRRLWLLLAVFLTPLALNFVAAVMHRFPYGGHIRMTLFLGSVFCMLMALGIAEALAWLAARRPDRGKGTVPFSSDENRDSPPPIPSPVITVLLGALALLAGATLLHDLVRPYKSGTTLRARAFARWFWHDMAHDNELVCLETDLHENVSPGTFEWGWSALYLCNQRIYSARHRHGEPPHWDRVTAQRPLCCVAYRSKTEERDPQAIERWLGEMQPRYQLVARDRYPVPIHDKKDRATLTVDLIEVFKFVPKGRSTEEKTLTAKPRRVRSA